MTYTTEYAVVPSDVGGLKKGDTLTAEQLPELTTAGYTFAGWYNGETKIETGYTITEDLSLTAKWNVNTNTAYTVEHYQQNIADDGYTLVNADTENKTGTTDENTTATAKDYAGFTVKSVEQMKIAADGSTIIKIYYDRNTITLTLNLDGGEGDESIFGKYEEAVTTSANPTKTGYTFAGWNPSLPAAFPAENATYTAKWNANTYTVKFNANGGSGNMGNQTFTYDTEQALPANTFTRADYAFAGWAVSADGDVTYTDMGKVKNLTSENNATVILYAVWEIENYTITYDLDGGSWKDGFTPVTVRNANTGITLPTADNIEKTNYVFIGWYDENGDKVTQILSDTAKHITVTTKWWDSTGFVYVQGATITGAITGSGYTTSDTFGNGKTVTVRNFYICDHEVTQAEYKKYCSYTDENYTPSSTYGVGDNYPAYYVSWYDALVYCNKRSMDEGLTPCYKINGSSTDPDDWGDGYI